MIQLQASNLVYGLMTLTAFCAGKRCVYVNVHVNCKLSKVDTHPHSWASCILVPSACGLCSCD